MLGHKAQNFHHSRLPPRGQIGFIRGLSTVNPNRRCIVSHYPLTDSPGYRCSRGIHTIWVRFLHNGQLARFGGHWFVPEDEI